MSNKTKPQSIAFVDSGVPDVPRLLGGLNADVVVLLDPAKDAVGQITETLRGYSDLSSIVLVSHGSPGVLDFANGSLSLASLPRYQRALAEWSNALTPDADILLYGCSVAQGESGRAFVDKLAALTGADVAASTNVTGARVQGGDWSLEYWTGPIDRRVGVSSELRQGYEGLLAAGVLSVSGTPTQRQTLVANLSDVDGFPADGSVAYLWQQSGDGGNTWSDIAGATNVAFTLRQAQVGAQVRAVATYTDAQGASERVASVGTSLVANVNDVGIASITGTPVQGQSLRAAIGDLDGLPTANVTYAWQQLIGSTWSSISGATGASLSLQAAQVGRQVRVRVSYTDLLGTTESSRTSGPTPTIVASNPTGNDVGAVSIAGTVTQYQTLAASVTDIDGLPAGTSIGYRWQQLEGSNWNDVAGAVGGFLVLDQAQVGKQIRAIASYFDASGASETVTSAPTAAVGNVNDVGVVSVRGAAVQGGVLTAQVTDPDGLVGVPVSYQWQQLNGTSWSNISGATSPNLTLTSAQLGRQARVRATYTDQLGGKESGRTSAATPAIVTGNNSLGSVSVSGTAAQGETLTATVSDADGVPGTISYQWQQSANGTSWTAIGGATARTLTLQQAQVGQQVRAVASYIDVRSNGENVTSAATAAVANVNDVGAVQISGIVAQNQTLTASVTDVDGLTGVAISYQWRQRNDSTSSWSDVSGATTGTLVLQQAQVGKQLQVAATYTDALGGSESVVSGPTDSVAPLSSSPVSIFTTQTPSQTNFTDGPGVDWEYGMKFVSDTPGVIQAIRYYKSPSETGTHVGRIWSATGQPLANVTFVNEAGSGWVQQALPTPLTIDAGATYVVSVNTNGYYAVTSNGFSASIKNDVLTAPVGAGVYNANPGAFPTLVYANENYFRDVVFTPGSSVALRDNSTVFVSETAGIATIAVVRTGNTQERMTLEYTTNEIGAAGAAQAGTDYTQPTLDGRANTGQVVFEIGDTVKTFTIPIVNDQLIEGNETFAVGLQNPSSGSLGAPRTVLVTIVDDDSPSTISMSQPAVTVSEGLPTATVTLQRTGSIDGTASVDFATSNGTATAGSDYTATSGTVSFAVGQLTQTISIPILNDIVTEPDETFGVTLSNPSSGVSLGSQTTATVTILDNDLTLGNLVRQTVVTGLSEPTALDWTPDGRYMVVAQQNGVVRLVDNGILRSTPLVDLSSQVNYTPGDRGLLGIAIHPNFASNPYVYLLHTYDPPETAGRSGLAGPDTQGNRPSRLVRLTVNPATMVADPASLVVIVGKNSTWAYTSRPDVNSNGARNVPPSGIVNGINNSFDNGLGTVTTVPANQIDAGAQDNDPDRAGVQNLNIRDYLASDGDSHSNGAVHFGPDGWLYLSNGDGTSYNFMDPRSVRVQDVDNLSGKVLRINPDTGEGVPGNPFYESGDPNSNQSKVFYSGVRNAFRFTFDPVTNLPVVGDVGWTTWEEINTGAPGSNFGWPYLEGPNQTGSYQTLSQAITFYNNGNRNSAGDQPAVFPMLSRSHGAPDNATAVVVGDFYNSNTLMFGDLLNGTLYAATLDASRKVTGVQVFDSNIPNIVDMEMGPDGRLYGVDLAAGSIRRWVDAGGGGGALAASGL